MTVLLMALSLANYKLRLHYCYFKIRMTVLLMALSGSSSSYATEVPMSRM